MTAEDKAVAALAATLASPGWQRVIFPTLQKQMLLAADQLSKLDRPSTVPDDYLRGQVAGLKFAASYFQQQIAEYEAAKQASEPQAPAEPIGSPYINAEVNPPVGV